MSPKSVTNGAQEILVSVTCSVSGSPLILHHLADDSCSPLTPPIDRIRILLHSFRISLADSSNHTHFRDRHFLVD